ncbi:MAG: hypothetical protein PHS41_13150, partial [Victivallaceae bacterium]|nr:hypothetical protein [Victivallaceae bacterium]
DKLDYLAYVCKQRGIYLTLDFFGVRNLPKGSLAAAPDYAVDHREYKALMLIDEEVMRDYESFVTNFLTHVNRYTKMAWKVDPVLAFASLANEGTIFQSWDRGKLSRKRYEEAFERYCAERKISPEGYSGSPDWRDFLVEVYRVAWNRFRSLIRDRIGCRVPLTDQNYWSSAPMVLVRNQFDYVDNHFYWAHPVFPNRKFHSLPSVVMNESAISRRGGSIGNLFPSRIFGKPFTVSEWDYVNPNSYNVEGAFLTGAYAALQDWSMLCRFQWMTDPAELKREESPIDFFRTKNDPLRVLSERAGVLFFLRGDVAASRKSYAFLIQNGGIPEEYPAALFQLGLIGRIGSVALPGSVPRESKFTLGFYPQKESLLPHYVPGIPDEDLKKLMKRKLLPEDAVNLAKEQFRSSTGEIVLDAGKEIFHVSTPRSEGCVLGGGQSSAGRFLTVVRTDIFAAFFAGSLDGEALSKSKRILLLHLTDTKNTGMTFTNADCNTCIDEGTLPLLVRRGVAEIELARAFGGDWKCYMLDLDGTRIGTLDFRSTAVGKTWLRLATDRSGKAVAAYELVKE